MCIYQIYQLFAEESIKLFADDAKLYTAVDSTEKTQCFQESLGS